MYDRILVPTDGSEGVERAVRHAIDLACAHDAELHGVYVVDASGYGGLPMETSWDGIRDVLVDEADDAVARVEALAGDAGVAVETRVLEGSPSKRIAEYGEEAGCDLIVMGTHGRGGIDRLLLGSVAERVVRCSEVPVLTVRVGDGEARVGEARTGERDASAADVEEVDSGSGGQV